MRYRRTARAPPPRGSSPSNTKKHTDGCVTICAQDRTPWQQDG